MLGLTQRRALTVAVIVATLLPALASCGSKQPGAYEQGAKKACARFAETSEDDFTYFKLDYSISDTFEKRGYGEIDEEQIGAIRDRMNSTCPQVIKMYERDLQAATDAVEKDGKSDGSDNSTDEPNFDTCNDKTGDGGPVDLVKVTVTKNTDVTVVFDLADTLPTSGTAMIGIMVHSADGNQGRRLEALWTDGTVPGPAIYELGTSEYSTLGAANLEVVGKRVTMTVPDYLVSDLGQDWEWFAFSTAATEDVDACPGEPLSYETRTFPN